MTTAEAIQTAKGANPFASGARLTELNGYPAGMGAGRTLVHRGRKPQQIFAAICMPYMTRATVPSAFDRFASPV
jgi:hypothetical protein